MEDRLSICHPIPDRLLSLSSEELLSKPAGNRLQPFDAMPGLARSGQFVGLTREAHQLGLFPTPFEGGEQLLGLLYGTTPIFLRVDNQQWRFDLVGL